MIFVSILGVYFIGAITTFVICQYILAKRDTKLASMEKERDSIPDAEWDKRRKFSEEIYEIRKKGSYLIFPLWDSSDDFPGILAIVWPVELTIKMVCLPFLSIYRFTRYADNSLRKSFVGMIVKKNSKQIALASSKNAAQNVFREGNHSCQLCGADKEAWTKLEED